MTENAEAEGRVAKKRPAKKATKAAKKTARKTPAKKAAKKAVASSRPAAKRGRPAGKKAARKTARRGKKNAKQFAYMLETPQEDGSLKAGQINGPFASESNALDDASIMADDSTVITIFRASKRGKVQKSTKFVAGR